METKQDECDTPPKLESNSIGDESEQQKKKTPPASTETETDRTDDEIAELKLKRIQAKRRFTSTRRALLVSLREDDPYSYEVEGELTEIIELGEAVIELVNCLICNYKKKDGRTNVMTSIQEIEDVQEQLSNVEEAVGRRLDESRRFSSLHRYGPTGYNPDEAQTSASTWGHTTAWSPQYPGGITDAQQRDAFAYDRSVNPTTSTTTTSSSMSTSHNVYNTNIECNVSGAAKSVIGDMSTNVSETVDRKINIVSAVSSSPIDMGINASVVATSRSDHKATLSPTTATADTTTYTTWATTN